MEESIKILEINNLSKSFPGVNALINFDFDLYVGEIHCLVGENGAGKSTFIKILSGAQRPDRGKLKIFGNDYNYLTPLMAILLGIQTVYQESVLINKLSVAENILLGNEPTNKYKFFSMNACIEKTKELIRSFKINIDPIAKVSDLSIAEKQIVCILKALSRNVKVLILDEPTSSLTSNEINILFSLLKEIINRKISVIYISHRLEEIFEIGNRVTVLRDGQKVGTHNISDINFNILVKEMIGRSAERFYRKDIVINKLREKNVLKVENFSGAGFISDVSFAAESGKIFGLGGMVGSGRTELAKLIVGIEKLYMGNLYLNGKRIIPKSPISTIREGICLIPEDRQKAGLILERSVRENISITNNELNSKFFLNMKLESMIVKTYINTLNIATESMEKKVKFLSGGNQQKVVLAKWLATKCKVFIFDEPTRGIDIGAKEEIYKIISNLVNENKIVIVISSDMPELVSLSDMVGIMRDGRLVKILPKIEVNEEKILTYALGVNNE